MPSTHVICGDCMEVVPRLEMEFDFIFADPPFNIGHGYTGYNDRIDSKEFSEKITSVAVLLKDKLSRYGVMALHGPDNLAAMWLRAESQIGLSRIAWVNWHYRFGQCTRSNWIDARCHCLIYARDADRYTWNPEDVLVESDRVRYGDKRIHETENGGTRLPGTVWGVDGDGKYWGRVQGQNTERRGLHPNQLPEVYLERLIRAYTKPGDWILDPFGGSGTTIVVASELRRNCITIDISKENTESIKDRLMKGAVRVKYAQ